MNTMRFHHITAICLCSLIFGGALVASAYLACEAYRDGKAMNEKAETERAVYRALIAQFESEKAGHEAKKTEQLVFFMTQTDYPVEKFGCPVPGLQKVLTDKNGKPLKGKGGKIKTKVIC